MRSILILVVFASTARAQSAGAQAEALFTAGKELMKAGKLTEACQRFEAAQKLEPTTMTVVTLGDCREQNQQFASALSLYLRAERELRGLTDATGVQLHELVKQRAAALLPRLSHLTIKIDSDAAQPKVLEILLENDKVEEGAWNQPLPVDGGTYHISARAPGHREWMTTVHI